MIQPKTALLWMTFLLSIPLNDLRADSTPGYQVIVNAQNPITNLNRRFVADTYLKKIKHWPEDGVIQPVDLKPDSSTRRTFSEAVLDRSVMGVKSYWQQLIFSGTDVPPPELGNDLEVIKYVSKHLESIGYVSSSSLSGASGVKPVSIQ